MKNNDIEVGEMWDRMITLKSFKDNTAALSLKYV